MLAGFVPGSIQGQDGWTGGTIAIPAQVVQTVDQTGTNAHAGIGAWQVSNSTANGGYNGNFSGWPFGPGLTVSAGQPLSGAGADRFSATYFFKSASAVADGSNIEIDLGTSDGLDRNTFLAITNRAGVDGGLQIRMAESDLSAGAGNDYFYSTQVVATGISRVTWHRIDIQATFIDGPSNDTFQVSLDGGVPFTNTSSPFSPNDGTANWGTFEGYRDGNGFAYELSNRLYFRSGAAPSGYGAFSDTGAAGFYFDDIGYKDWNSASPSTILASYAATFEPAGTTTTPVYVDDSWASMPVGTDPDGVGPATAFGYDAFSTIQEGVNAVTVGGTVNVAAGTYVEDVTIGTSVTLLGAGAGSTTVSGAIGGGGTTLQVAANDVAITGFTITREGNNTTSWNGALNTAGIAVQGAVTGMLVHDNILTGNRTGIDINNSSGHTIRNNNITFNRTGMILRNQTDNLTVVENNINNNWTVGILFLDASGGTNVPVQTALNSTFSNNNLSGNWYGQIVDRQIGGSLPVPGTTNLKNFSGNWFGTNTPVISAANSTEPSYSGQIPVAYGGTAVPPGGQPDVLGPASANFDITPLLDLGTDTNVETTPGRGIFGFQGDFSILDVTTQLAQTGTSGRIQEGVNHLANGSLLAGARMVQVAAGSYAGDVDTTTKALTIVPNTATGTAGIGTVTVNGNLKLDGNDTLALQFTNTANDMLIVNGTVNLGGATLSVSSTASLPPASYTVIDNDSVDAVPSTFNGLPSNATLLLNGVSYKISYSGGTGNDVTLSLAGSSSVVVSGTSLIVFGTGDKDEIQIKDKNGALNVSVRSKTFDFDGVFAGITTIVVYGYAGDDHIMLHKQVTARAFLFGGDGKDHIEAGGGNTVLVGGIGDDDLNGGDGRNILIGGTGGDKLEGKDGEDILIGATTRYDNNLAALDAILAQWEGGGSYAARVSSLSDAWLNTSTVIDDSESDDLKGGKGLDWFFADTNNVDKMKRDKLTDFASGETSIEV